MNLKWGFLDIKQPLELFRGVMRLDRLYEIYPEWNHKSVDVNIFSIFVDADASTRFLEICSKIDFFRFLIKIWAKSTKFERQRVREPDQAKQGASFGVYATFIAHFGDFLRIVKNREISKMLENRQLPPGKLWRPSPQTVCKICTNALGFGFFRETWCLKKFCLLKYQILKLWIFFDFFEKFGFFLWKMLENDAVVDVNSKSGSTGRQHGVLARNRFFDKNYICNSQGLPKYWLKRALDSGENQFSLIWS